MGPNGQPQNPLSYAVSFVSRVVKSGRYTTGKIELSANSSTFLNLSCTLQIMVEHTGLLRWLFTIVWGKYFMMATPLGGYRLLLVGCLMVKPDECIYFMSEASLYTHKRILSLLTPLVVGKHQKRDVRDSKKSMQKQTSFMQCLCTRFYRLFTRKHR